VQIKPEIFTRHRCKSAKLIFSCCDSVEALAFANCNEHVAEANTTAPAHTQLSLHGAQISRDKSGEIALFSRSGYTRACLQHFLFSVPNYHTEILTFLRSSTGFFPACSPPSGCFFARDCSHAGMPV